MTRCLFRPEVAAAILCIFVYAGGFEERWAYHSGSVAGDAKAAQKAISFFKQAKACEVTHALIGENPAVGAEVSNDMIQNAKEVLASAKDMKITIVPGVCPIGYSGRFLGKYPDLAAGIPVRNARFVVRGRTAVPDDGDAPSLVNAGFDELSAGRIAGWTRQDLAGLHSMSDTTIKHAGPASLEIADLDKLPNEDGNRTCTILAGPNTVLKSLINKHNQRSGRARSGLSWLRLVALKLVRAQFRAQPSVFTLTDPEQAFQALTGYSLDISSPLT